MVARGSECCVLSPIRNELRVTDGPVWQPSDSVSLALGLGNPQTLVLHHQAPWDGPLGGRPRVRVSPGEARRCELMAVGPAEWQAKMRMLGGGAWAQGFWHGESLNIAWSSQ